jgi:hypothetical protein
MTKTILLAALLAVLATEVSAQSGAFYDASGRRIGSATTDSQGTVTNYDSPWPRHQSRDHNGQHDHDLRLARPHLGGSATRR